MGWIERLMQPKAEAIGSDSILKQLLAGASSSTGISVTPETALRASAVYACVAVRAQSIAQLPVNLYRRTYKNGREGKEKATDHPLYAKLHLRPNGYMPVFNFKEMLTAHNDLRGNSYAFINRVGGGRIAELVPLHPDNVKIELDAVRMEPKFSVKMKAGSFEEVRRDQIFHLCGMTFNGWSGVTPITYARETIGLSLAAEKFGALSFKNGAKMGGVLLYPGHFKHAETAAAVGESFDAKTSGDNAHKTIVLEDGMKWEKISMTHDDAQYLETRQFQVPEVARFFRMPLHKIQELTRATFSNIEQQSIEFVTDCIGPPIVRWEQALNIQLLTEKEQLEYFFEFNVDALMRGDIKSRYEAYSRGILAGFLNRNEVRAKENMDWAEGLDEFLQPSNMFIAEGQQTGGNQQ